MDGQVDVPHLFRKHYEKKVSWKKQCDALRNLRLGNLGSCLLCGCRPSTPLHGSVWRFPLIQLLVIQRALRSTGTLKMFQLSSKRLLRFPLWKQNSQNVAKLQEWFEEHQRVQGASLVYAERTSPIHGDPTSQCTGLKGSAANVLVPDSTAHFQRSTPRQVRVV